jgi:hypothetical protein
VRVDQADLRRRHPHLHAAPRDPDVAGDGHLEPAADRVAVDRCYHRIAISLDRLDGRCERVRDERLGLLGEVLVVEGADVVAGREHRGLAGDDHAARVERAERLRERVEDLVVESAALPRVVYAQACDERRGLVEDELA